MNTNLRVQRYSASQHHKPLPASLFVCLIPSLRIASVCAFCVVKITFKDWVKTANNSCVFSLQLRVLDSNVLKLRLPNITYMHAISN